MSTRRVPILSDPDQAAEHVGAVIDDRELWRTTALVICCDDQGLPTAHLHVVDCDLDASPSDCVGVLDSLVDRVVAAERAGPDRPAWRPEAGDLVRGLVVGLTRPGGEQILPYDRAWLRALHRVGHRRGLVPYGVYVVTRHGTRGVHIDDAA